MDRLLTLLLLLLGVTAALPHFVVLPAPLLPLLPLLPSLLLLAGLLLSLFYQQGRIGFYIALCLGYLLCLDQLPKEAWGMQLWALSLLMPFALLIARLLPAALLLHRRAWIHWLLLLALALAAWGSTQLPQAQPLFAWLELRSLAPIAWSPAPLLLLVVQAIVALSCALLYLSERDSDAAALLMSQLLLLLAPIALTLPHGLALLGLAMGVAMLLLVLAHGHQLAFIDELTQIPGRRALMLALARTGRRYSLAMVDIDHFKAFNDTHGHEVGDEVLKLVAQRLTKVKAGGKVYRYGGEEFTILFNGKQPKQCKAALEAVREDLASYPFVVRKAKQRPKDNKQGRSQRGDGGGKTVQVTISLGLANRTAERSGYEAVMKAADQALYGAKKAGRNRLKLAPKCNL